MKRPLLPTLLFVCLVLPLSAKEKKIHGYVTNVVSPTVFEIEDYRITRDQGLVLELEKEEGTESIEFHPQDIRVGTELEIKGEFNDSTGEMQARSIKVFLADQKKIKRTALIERAPTIKRETGGWAGTFFADGEHIHVTPATQVLFRPTKSDRKASKEREKKHTERPGAADAREETGIEASPLESLDQIGANTFMAYEGHREPEGSILASRVEFTRNEVEPGEAKLWKHVEPKVKEPDYRRGKPGELKISRVGRWKLLPNEEVQKYVEQVGESLVPPFQRNLPAADPRKIPFRFFVVDKRPANATTLPNGVVIVHSAMFEILENEAQLAAVLGHEITHSVERHQWREMQYHKKKRIGLMIGSAVAAGFGASGVSNLLDMIEAAVRNGYSRALENQADREGLDHMVEAGYDPREAPRLWKLMTKQYGDRPTEFFWSSHDSNTLRRSYLMAELRNNYGDLDFSHLKKGEEPFRRIASLAREASQSKEKVKVKY